MAILPVTFEEIQGFLIEQERIVTKSIKNDDRLQQNIKKNKIDINEDELEEIIKRINKQLKRKYRIKWFTRQARFQVSQQVISLEKGIKMDDKIKKIDNVNNILKVFDEESDIIDDRILDMVKELPDSNLVETNNVELIEEYDNIRDKLLKDIRKRKRYERNIDKLKNINEKLEKLVRESKSNDISKANDDNIKDAIDKLRYLLALKGV